MPPSVNSHVHGAHTILYAFAIIAGEHAQACKLDVSTASYSRTHYAELDHFATRICPISGFGGDMYHTESMSRLGRALAGDQEDRERELHQGL